jgi:hypothetical protein
MKYLIAVLYIFCAFNTGHSTQLVQPGRCRDHLDTISVRDLDETHHLKLPASFRDGMVLVDSSG